MRKFPDPSTDTLTAFAFHSTRMERIPISREDIDQTLSKAKINPYLEGQFKTCNLLLVLAADDNLIPAMPPVTWRETIQQTAFLKQIHLNLFRTVAEYGELTNDPSVIKPNQVGEWREERKWLPGQEMPNPVNVPHHLHAWWEDLIEFHNRYREKIEMPRLLEDHDIKVLADKAYETNLKLCCIKPFVDGSNRVARCTENLLRLYFGLPFKIISHHDDAKLPYINDIKEMQKNYLE